MWTEKRSSGCSVEGYSKTILWHWLAYMYIDSLTVYIVVSCVMCLLGFVERSSVIMLQREGTCCLDVVSYLVWREGRVFAVRPDWLCGGTELGRCS